MKLLMSMVGLLALTLASPQACSRTPDKSNSPAAVPGPYVHVNVRVLDADARPVERSFPQIIAIGFQGNGKSIPLVVVSDKGGEHGLVSVLNVTARYAPEQTVAIAITITVGLHYLDTATVEVTNEHGRSIPHQGFDYYEQTNSGATDPVAIRLTVPVTR